MELTRLQKQLIGGLVLLKEQVDGIENKYVSDEQAEIIAKNIMNDNDYTWDEKTDAIKGIVQAVCEDLKQS